MKNMRAPVFYIDPGTGGMIVSSLWTVIAGFIAVIAGFIAASFIRPLRKAFRNFWDKKYIRFGLFIVIIMVIGYTLQIAGCGINCATGLVTEGDYMGKKVLVIGIDALDPKVMDKLMSEGKLPNFKKLRETGSYSELETTIPPETPVAWSAAATGGNPGRYGIFDFVNRDPNTYLPKLNLAEESRGMLGTSYKSAMKGIPFWRITSQNGIPTTVIRWPVTFPPESVNRRMLSGLGVVDIRGFLNSYSFYTTGNHEKGPEDVGKVVKLDKPEGPGSVFETSMFGPLVRSGQGVGESEIPMKITSNDDHAVIEVDGNEYRVEKNGWSEWIRAKFKVDMLTDVYGIFRVYVIQTGSEFSMYVTSVQIDPENPVVDITYPREYGKELAGEIGLFYTLGMPEDTKAVTENRISLDVFMEQIRHIEEEREKMFWHEFSRFDKDGGLYAFGFDAGDRLQHIFWDKGSVSKEIEGYYVDKDRFLGEVLSRLDKETVLIVFSDHGFSSFERVVCINKWLVDSGYMVLTDEVSEEDSGGLFKYVDWSRTKAYSLGFASIYINLNGREGNGVVEESEKEALVDEIIDKLSGLTDSKTGGKAVTNLYRSSEVYDGDYAGSAPDIIIGFNEGYRMSWRTAVGGVSTDVFADNEQEWTGDHLIDRSHVPGVVFTSFDISKESPSMIDIAPTVLYLLDIEIPEHIDGKSLVI